jgi:broad specificity phosphatase PhoE
MLRHAQSTSNEKADEVIKIGVGREQDPEYLQMVKTEVHLNEELRDAPLTELGISQIKAL